MAHGGFDDARVTGRMPGGGVAVRGVFHQQRSWAIENVSGRRKGLSDPGLQVPTRGLARTRHRASGATFVSRLRLLHRVQRGGDLSVGLNAFVKAA